MEEILVKLDAFLQWNFPPKVQGMVNVVLVLFGFAFVVGLIARLLIPGRWGHGAFAVLLIGLTGSCLGLLFITTWRKLEDFNPISPAGLIVSILSAVVALLLFHMTMILFPPRDHQDE